ncbi:histidine kinase [Paenibacillus sp. LS1]|uniref:histidine kinase n=1 Tax=Paenibacillus sp. LS1 TaxID=2992120 RepID=UPI00222E101F|nr:histidine kinase [Paenibacillus sp. LS1]MCW3791668.1 histidine kinase [Paenibacillus sp. LS1]
MDVIGKDRFLLGLGCMTLLFVLVMLLQMIGAKDVPVAKHGILDLGDASGLGTSIVPLDGEWEFYPEQLLSPEQIDQTITRPVLMTVPGNWEDEQINNGYPMSGKGYGTYRLIVRNIPQDEQMGLSKRYVRFSDTLYVDGKLMGRSGLPGISTEVYQPRNEPYTVYFQAENTELEIVLQVANFDFRSGGIYSSIELGQAKRIEARTIIQSGLELLIIGILLIFGLLFLYLYMRLHRDAVQLLYVLFFLGYALMVITNGERLLLQLFPEMPFELAFKLKNVAVYGVPVIVSMIVLRLVARKPSWKWLQGLSLVLTLYLILIIVTPFRVYSYLQDIMYMVNLLTYAVSFIIIMREYVMRRYGSKTRSQFQLLLTCIWIMVVNHVLAIWVIWNPISQIWLNGTVLFMLAAFTALLIYQYVRAYDSMQRLTRQLQLTDRVKDEFLLLTSHELNSPLHSIIHLSRSLLGTSMRRANESEVRQKLQVIRNTAYRMSNLVNDLIDMSRFKDGKMKVAVGTVDLVSCLSLVTEVLGFLATGKGILVIHRMAPEARYIIADENRLLQVLYNLVYHMIGQHSHRELIFECERDQEHVRIRLRFEVQSQVHDPLKGEEKHVPPKPDNVSAGLSIASELIRMMGGELTINDASEWIEMVLPSAGVIEMDVAAETAALRMEGSFEHTERLNANTATILIATTDLVDMEHLDTLLSMEGFQVCFANSDLKVQSTLASGRLPDLVIVDALLPSITGYELCRQIREQFSQVELPVLFINMRSTPADIEACISSGGNDFITRPLDAGEILVRVHTMLGMKRLVKEAANNEMAFLRSQIKPHFLYNALGTIMSLCFTDGPRAGELLGSFSRYLRILFQLDNTEETIPLRKEMELIQAYAEIEQERFGSRLQIKLDVDQSLYSCKVMPLLIEPLVENAIRHGVSKKVSGGTVQLTIQRYEDMVEVIVEDDGIGMSAEQVEMIWDRNTAEQGIGLQNVQRRLKLLNGQTPIIWSEQGTGTKVTIVFPFQ